MSSRPRGPPKPVNSTALNRFGAWALVDTIASDLVSSGSAQVGLVARGADYIMARDQYLTRKV